MATIPINRSEWLKERSKGVGGSDIAAVFSEKPYGCARRLWYEKSGIDADYLRPVTEAMQRGTRLEEIVAEEYALASGNKVRRMPTRVHPQHSWARVNVDRQIVNDQRGPGALECKTANERVFRDIKRSGLPIAYALQLQHALFVTGYKWGAFAVLWPDGWQLVTFEVERDEALIGLIASKGAEFWEMVQNRNPPDRLSEREDSRCQTCEWRKTCRGLSAPVVLPEEESGIEVASDESLADLAADLMEARRMREDAESVEESIKAALVEALGQRPVVDVPSVGVRFYHRPVITTRLDSAALKKAHPDIVSQFTKTNTTTPFRVITFDNER